MASTFSIIAGGLAALLFWSTLGFPLARRIFPKGVALAIAPILGWAAHAAIALPVLRIVGISQVAVLAMSAAILAASLALLMMPASEEKAELPPPRAAYALAALLSLLPALAIMPKIAANAVALAPPIFDHSKIAIVDEIAGNGLPPGNPFVGSAESPLAYYYLWHFSAALMAVAFGISGWEADAALTGVTAFASLCAMIGLAGWIGGRPAALWVPLLSFAGSLRTTLEFVFGTDAVEYVLRRQTGLAAWLFQTTWAPQHVMSATCLVVAIVVIVRIARRPRAFDAAILALIVAACCQSSIWNGILFGIAVPLVALVLLVNPETKRRGFILWSFAAAILALLLAFPLLRDLAASAGARDTGMAVAIHPYEVFSLPHQIFPTRLLDIPGYWLVFLLVEFPAIYAPGALALLSAARPRGGPGDMALTSRAFLVVVASSLIVGGYLTITFSDNNDLGWRATLPAILLLTVFAAAGLSRWIAERRIVAAVAFALIALSLPKSFEWASEYVKGMPTPSGQAFAKTPALWQAVRRQTGPADRIAMNPSFLAEMTPWTINISWALLADRRSCFAGRDYLGPFTTLTSEQQQDVIERFRRVFAGEARQDDVETLAQHDRCRVAVLTALDGAWRNDPFAASGLYTRVNETADWRIYRVAGETAK